MSSPDPAVSTFEMTPLDVRDIEFALRFTAATWPSLRAAPDLAERNQQLVAQFRRLAQQLADNILAPTGLTPLPMPLDDKFVLFGGPDLALVGMALANFRAMLDDPKIQALAARTSLPGAAILAAVRAPTERLWRLVCERHPLLAEFDDGLRKIMGRDK